jgi:hypothetical protein
MCCIFAVLLLLGPRAGIFLWWLYDPSRWNIVFGGFIVPFLGFLLLPWTTLMYVAVWTIGGIDAFSWFLVALAFLVDIASYTGGGYTNRDRMSGYYSSRY